MTEIYAPPGRPYGVFAEMHEGGGPQVLRWFATEDEAQAHPIKLSLWKRVWVEKRPHPSRIVRSGALPWRVEEPCGSSFTYIRDAEDNRILSMLGSKEDRDKIVAIMKTKGLI